MATLLATDPSMFKQQSAVVLSRLRSRVVDLLDTVPGQVRKSRDVQKYFGLDAKLSWQLFRIVTGGNPLELSVHVPTTIPLHKFLDAAVRQGVAPTLVASVREAFDEYERYVETHAGDRKVFESMLSDMTDGDAATQGDVQHRKFTFECHRHFWGLQAHTHISATLLCPTAGSTDRVDVVRVFSVLGIERLRANVAAVLPHPLMIDAERLGGAAADSAESGRDWFPLTDVDGIAGASVPVLPRFSSTPLPSISVSETPGLSGQLSISGSDVGRQAAFDISFGCVQRGLKVSRDESSPTRVCVSPVQAFRLPTQAFVSDVILHQPRMNRVEQSTSLYGHFPGWPRSYGAALPEPQLPCRDRPVPLGIGGAALRLPDAPQYVELIRFACDRMGWDLDEFEAYRLTIPFPMLNTSLVSRVSWSMG